MRFLLRFFKIESLVRELLRREFPSVDAQSTAVTWKETFHKVPTMRDWLRRREMILLKSYALKEKSPEYILGQIAETKLALSFDVPSESVGVDVGTTEPIKLPSRSKFLSGWRKQSDAIS